MRQVDRALPGIHLQSDYSCCISRTWALAGSATAKHDALSYYAYSAQIHFGALTAVICHYQMEIFYLLPKIFDSKIPLLALNCGPFIPAIRDRPAHHFKVIGVFDTCLLDIIVTFRSPEYYKLQ